MKNFLIPVFICTILIGSFSCKKEEPIPVTAPPVFFFRGNVDGSPVNLEAGVNNYYMYSNFNQDANNLYSFSGNLGVYNCTNCGNMLQVKINDFQTTSLNGNVAIQNSLMCGNYNYYAQGGTPTEYVANFYCAETNGTGQNFLWDFGDGNTSIQMHNTTHIYTHPGIYHVKCRVDFGSVVDSTEYNVNIAVPESELDGSFGSTASGNMLYFTSTINGTPPYTYYWDFGDGNNITTSSAPVQHSYANMGVYTVYMRVTDMDGGSIEMVRKCATQNYTGSYSSWYMAAQNANANPLGFSNITITWTDAAGMVYSSANSYQPYNSFFKILSVDDYQNNSTGQRTKKIHLNFKCKLYSTSDSLQVDNGDAVIAVAYQ